MSDAESTHDEHLDSWGKMRRDAIRDYGAAASQAMWAGGRWNKVKSFFAGVGEAAADLAPRSWAGVALEIGTLAGGATISKLAKLRGLTNLYHSAHEARTAGKILELGRTIFRDQGYPQLAESLGKWHRPKILYSAAKAATEAIHSVSSLRHSIPQIVKYTPGLVRELKSILANAPATKTIHLQPKPVVEQGIAYKSGVVFFPKNRQFILPPVVVTHRSHKLTHGTPAMAIPRTAAPSGSISRLRLTMPMPPHHRLGFHIPKLHLSNAFAPAAKTRSFSSMHAAGTTSRMKLQLPKLGASVGMRRPVFSPIRHRAPVIRRFRR